MSLSSKNHPLSLIVFLLGLLLLFSQIACSDIQQETVDSFLANVSGKIDATLEYPSELLFAGQIVDDNGEWQNDYVVVLFKEDKEVARTTSRLLDNALTDEGPMDGVFELRIPNEYKLTPEHKFQYTNKVTVTMATVPGMIRTQYVGAWLGELNPNEMQIIKVEEKQVQYTIVVLGLPLNELPESHSQGRLAFNVETKELVTNVQTEKEIEAAKTVDSTNPAPQTSIQFKVFPSQNSGLEWRMQITGYYGNRWDVWERFIKGYVSGMDWETFQESVLVHNPQLESDGFVFYPDKSYLLPINQ